MRKVITAITTRTDAEWPADHPLRKNAVVMSNKDLAELTSPPLWVCSIVGEERLPTPADDPDATAQCARCPNAIVFRASVPASAEKICHRCFVRIGGKMAE